MFFFEIFLLSLLPSFCLSNPRVQFVFLKYSGERDLPWNVVDLQGETLKENRLFFS